jgi:hypothetical protein
VIDDVKEIAPREKRTKTRMRTQVNLFISFTCPTD